MKTDRAAQKFGDRTRPPAKPSDESEGEVILHHDD